MKFKLRLVIMVFLIIFTLYPLTTYSAKNYSFGIFTSSDSCDLNKFLKYKEIVVDATIFSKEDIDYLHENGVKVFSYINIGSLEKFRPYYEDFASITLSNYENWSNERWIDVSNPKWQNYVVNTLSKDLFSKGIDGLFIDNIDIYTIYKKDKIFNGIHCILKTLNDKYKKPIIINNGYDFIQKALSLKLNLTDLFYGLNKEEVFTIIENYENDIFRTNILEERNFVLSYLNTLSKKGINIYIIEYSKNKNLNKKMIKYYNKKNYKFFISSTVNL
ncbi:endo alpha-1,4 polygalactosaminidase [Clostridium aestuarii]|uniref:Endo alpha-1,4 polygalactosaminidase n=1 Tax=Clostridium aestuarii TaxID=338193 RepID=A0ABT4CVD9_9CLOT|nr:endo alpha-1,4 polygalactosaminidase [Clostridium aestuarii]MCY6482931.1 endo alpha-1,4 polygalactosaminidase [Clostridium aestuarii]